MSQALPVLNNGARVVVTNHAPGMPHVQATIKKMAELATAGAQTFPIRDLAVRITADVPSKQPRLELEALYRWVRDHVRYRFDPVDLEWVQSPARTVQQRAGDCDDLSTLLAALAGSLGHRWRFRTIGPTPQAQRHVAAEAFDGQTWVTLDPVLEPAGRTTAPRADLGRFGHKAAGGSEYLWNMGGQLMPKRNLSGPVQPYEVALWRGHLGAVPTPQQRRLWTQGDVEYYPQVGRVTPGAGVAARPADTYASFYTTQMWLFRPSSSSGASGGGMSGLGQQRAEGSCVLVLPWGVIDTCKLDGVVAGPNGERFFWMQDSGLGRTDAGSKADTPDRLRFVWGWYVFEPPAKRPKGWTPNAPDEQILAWWSTVSPDNRQMFRESYAATQDYAPKDFNDAQKREWWVKLSKDQRVDKRRHYQGGFWGSLKQIGADIIKPIAKVHAATTGRVTSFLHKITHTGPIRDIEKQVQKVVGVVPFFKPFIDFHEKTSSRITETVMAETGAIKKSQMRDGGKIEKPTLEQSAELLDKGSGGRITPQKGIEAAGKAASSAAGKAGANIKIPAGVKAIGAKALQIPGVQAGAARAAAAAGRAVQSAAGKAVDAAGKAVASAGVTLPATPRRANWKEPHPDVRKKYPGNARQVFDSASSLFRVYVPKNTTTAIATQMRQALPAKLPGAAAQLRVPGMSGLGFLHLHFSGLGATMTAADYKRNGATFATLAANAVAAFIAKNKIPPGSALPAVLEFQKYDSLRANAGFTGVALKPDGVWGPNSRAAAAWYRGQLVTAQPAVKPALASTKLTWTPPVAAAVVKAAAAPAVKPAAPKPAAAVAAAPTQQPRISIDVTGPQVRPATPAPKPPAPAPVGPVTGYSQVGVEPNNPGLPPLGAPTSSSAAKPPVAATKPKPPPVVTKPKPPPVAVKPVATKPKPPIVIDVGPPAVRPAPYVPTPPPAYAGSPSRPIVIDMPEPMPPPVLPPGPGGATYADLPTEPLVQPKGSNNTTALLVGAGVIAYMAMQKGGGRRRRRR
jgi:Transglutaminase-like superfamily